MLICLKNWRVFKEELEEEEKDYKMALNLEENPFYIPEVIVGMHALINGHEYHLCDTYTFVGCWMSYPYSLIQCR
jgi:hypothetical protein